MLPITGDGSGEPALYRVPQFGESGASRIVLPGNGSQRRNLYLKHRRRATPPLSFWRRRVYMARNRFELEENLKERRAGSGYKCGKGRQALSGACKGDGAENQSKNGGEKAPARQRPLRQAGKARGRHRRISVRAAAVNANRQRRVRCSRRRREKARYLTFLQPKRLRIQRDHPSGRW